ncbi:MAG: beta strand repeat-containing protein, partial [Planctomyces sp.]
SQINAGTLNLQGSLTGGGNLDITSTATFTGNGTFTGPVAVSGTVAPGISTGTLNTGPVTFNSSSTLQLQIDGSSPGQFDALNSSGTVTLDGTLAISMASSFTPTAGQTFTVISATAITGSFNSLTGLTYSGGILLPVRTPTSLILIATPLPTGNISFSVDSSQMATDLATFFTDGTGSVNLTGSVNVAGQTLAGNFALSRQIAADNSPIITIAATSLALTLNGQSTNLISLSGGSGVLLLTSSGFAASVTASFAESISGIGLTGTGVSSTVGLAINTTSSAVSETVNVDGQNVAVSLPAGPFVRISADNTTLTTSVTDLTGNFVIETSGRGASREILLAASGLQTFIGDTGTVGDTTDDVGVRITNGSFAAVVLANGTFALSTSGTADLTNVTGITMTGTGFTEINTTGTSVNRTFTVGGSSRTLSAAANTQRFGPRNFRGGFNQFVDVSGDFLVERSVSGSTTTLKVGASSVNAFLGVNQGQAGEFGVKLNNAGLGLIIEKTSGLAPRFAVSTNGGTVALAGLTDLDLKGPLALNMNQLQRTVDDTIATLAGTSIDVDFTSSDIFRQFGGNLDLAIQNFTTTSGTFAFEKETSGSTTKIKVAGTSVFAFLGNDPNGIADSGDEIGIKITGGRFGGVLLHTSSGNSFAVDSTGSAELVGVPGLTVTGTMAARINTTGGTVNESIAMPSGSPVAVVFAAGESAAVFKGAVTGTAAGYASLGGTFVASKGTNRLTVAGSSITAQVGADSLAVKVTNGQLGIVVQTDTAKFAAVASGNTALEGIDGLTVTGTGSVRINRLGATINETIATPTGSVLVNFDTNTDVTQIRSTLNLQFQNYVYASGDFLVEKTTVADLTTFTLAASNLNAFLGVNYNATGEFGVKVTGAGVAMLVEKQGTNPTKYAISTTGGTVGIVGLAGVDLSGPLELDINKLGRIIDVDIPSPTGVTVPLE